jgi:nitrite reductase/ring-hydroxylating ferredoxin subunit
LSRVDHDLGAESDFPPGSKRLVDVAGRTIGLYNVDGALHAVLNRCPHALAPLCLADLTGTWLATSPDNPEYGFEGRVLRCIWHGWEWNIETGRTVYGTDPRRLSKYPVQVRDGRVLISMPRAQASGRLGPSRRRRRMT